MSCQHEAVWIVTRPVRGTASNVAKTRVKLRCGKADGHDGPHHDSEHDKSWDDRGGSPTHLIEHDEAAP